MGRTQLLQRMDLLEVSQMSCLKCESPLFPPVFLQLPQDQSICERCLQSESKKFIYLNLEMQAIEKRLKEMRQFASEGVERYREAVLGREGTREGSLEGGELYEQLEEQRKEAMRLHGQLRRLEQEEQLSMKEYQSEVAKCDEVHRNIAEQQSLLSQLAYLQQQIPLLSLPPTPP